MRMDKVSTFVARQIVADAVNSGVERGGRLENAAEMERRYEVGRTSLREALRVLEVLGVIDIKHGNQGGPVFRGAEPVRLARTLGLYSSVLEVTIGDLIEARLALETMAARLAALSSDREGLSILEAELEHMNSLDPANIEVMDHTDFGSFTLRFHEIVCHSTGNKFLSVISGAVVALLDSSLNRAGALRTYESEVRCDVMEVHRRIAVEILNGNADEAERLTLRHLEAYANGVRDDTPWLWDRVIDWQTTEW